MQQHPQNGDHFATHSNKLSHQQSSENQFGFNEIQYASPPNVANAPGTICQISGSSVNVVKTSFETRETVTHVSATSANLSSLNTIQHFPSPYPVNKKVGTISSIMKPHTMHISKGKVEIKEIDEDPLLLREKILQHYYDAIKEIKCNFKEKLQELFFVQSGGNMVDYPAWKLRPNPHLLSFLNVYRLDDTTALSTPTSTNTVSLPIKMQVAYTSSGVTNTPLLSQHLPTLIYSSDSNNIMSIPPAASMYGFVQGVHTPLINPIKKTFTSSGLTTVRQESLMGSKDLRSSCKQNDSLTPKISYSSPSCQPNQNTYTPTNSNQDEILGQVRHESDIVHRISMLRKNGLWSASRLSKVCEQPRKKCQWDFLLEEMQWLATDFSQEKKWKRNMAKKISRSVMKFHQDKLAYRRKVKKEETVRLKRIAGGIAKEVKNFWREIEKVACYKQQSRQDEQRRKALDLHLNFIVGQTEKYSSWLAEGMKESSVTSSQPSSKQVSDDDDFEPTTCAAFDDEETIAEEETRAREDGTNLEVKYRDELEALKEESEIPMEDLLKTLPPDMLQRISGSREREVGTEKNEDDSESENDDGADGESDASSSDSDINVDGAEDENDRSEEEYIANEEEMKDDEETIDVEEAYGEIDHQAELDDLQAEAELPMEELLKMYRKSSVAGANESDSQSAHHMESGSDSELHSEGETNIVYEKLEKPGESKNKGTDRLLLPEKSVECDTILKSSVPNQELTDAAATAESLQPKGFTLSTTQVKTKVPFLLRHSLREYQHIGLDWLVTMYQKQLNGILADEMGLGKTIQTIALLAHLACEEDCWGPHLIVVPTSVMLNWEYEFKKWCPGFKILTYFGTQKERKLKRAGWMKPNAFHVCITSYNLVIQDHQSFRRRKWKYLILDEAQNIKNFKSQRWQMLLNFHSQRRLLLTGTPLQNNLMELWSLMHFLMPNVFQSHQDFKEWFSNPLTGMIEGSTEYNDGIIKRLHTVLRPFLLRRLKTEVELQMPKKFEHVIRCRLSKRQRFLYDEFMSRTKTKETLEAGNFLSVINILMQLRKVCNHPDLFELRPTVSPLAMDKLVYSTASIVNNALSHSPFNDFSFTQWNFCFADYEQNMSAFQANRTRQLKIRRSLLEELYTSSTNCSNISDSNSEHQVSSSYFQPLSNVSKDIENTFSTSREAEVSRSYLDCISPSPTTAGFSTIGDILTRQLEQTLVYGDEEVVNVVDDEDEIYCPVIKKPKVEYVHTKSGVLLEDYVTDDVSAFYLPHLKKKSDEERSSKLCYGAMINERHCGAAPIYGLDLHHAVKIVDRNTQCILGTLLHQYNHHGLSDMLKDVIKTPEERLIERKNITDRFLLHILPVIASPITMKTSHVQPSEGIKRQNLQHNLRTTLYPKFEMLAPMVAHSLLQFPETRLVQYDCGKLQTLDILLRNLKAGKHRVLIFTQMTKMLDVLERFLNYHGFIYLRLDGSTKVDQRQVLMERFNKDNKIFVFILSTRSGGLGVNLTGADTVIFYDSDWNPTMDAQAQDRCHRIGQTRDVHIYRLVSDRTVEENILKKAQKKRLLGNIAIEGGNFTASYFKQNSVKELFEVEEKKADTTSSYQVVKKMKSSKEEDDGKEDEKKVPAMKNNLYEEALSKAEEEEDVIAAKQAKIEKDSELLEFNENTSPGENTIGEVSKVEKALATLEAELRPIERFALKYMELTNTFHVEDEVEETEKMLELKKKEWELDHLQSIKEAEEKKYAEEEDDMFFTYARDGIYSKVKKKLKNKKTSRESGKRCFELDHTQCSTTMKTKAEELSPSLGSIHSRIQPLIMKLGNERIAQIKKVAQQAIEAKTMQNVCESVKTRVRKQAMIYHSACKDTTPKKINPKKTVQKNNTQRKNPKQIPSTKNVKRGKPGPKPKPKAFADVSKTNTSFSKSSRNVQSQNIVHTENANISSQTMLHSASKAKKPVTLKDFISYTPNNLNLKSPPPRNLVPTAQMPTPLNVPPQLPITLSHDSFYTLNSELPNCHFMDGNIINNGTRHFCSVVNDAPTFNGILSKDEVARLHPIHTHSYIPSQFKGHSNNFSRDLPQFNGNSINCSRDLPSTTLRHNIPINKGNIVYAPSTLRNDSVVNYNCLIPNTNFKKLSEKNEVDVDVPTARPILLSHISSAASSPLHSPASSDSGSDVRRSSRTPRPKFVDDDWYLFS